MADGPAGFTQDFSCPALLRIPLGFRSLRVRGFHPLWRRFPEASTHDLSCRIAVLQPRRVRKPVGLGCSPFARHYWGNHCYFLFLGVLRCFSSPGSPPAEQDSAPSAHWVVPFGNLRINGYLRLPGAYRSLSRPSSPVRAQASTVRPYVLSAACAVYILKAVLCSMSCLITYL